MTVTTCSRLVASAMLALAFVFPAVGQDPDAAWIQAGAERAAAYEASVREDFTPQVSDERYREIARELLEGHRRVVAEAMQQSAETPNAPTPEADGANGEGERIIVFETLGEDLERLDDLERALKSLRGLKNIRVVLRGLPDGTSTITEMVRILAGVLRAVPDGPEVVLDPTAYQRYGVTVAPTILYEKDGEALAWVRGSLAVEWLREEVASGRRGDLGKRGPTHAIVERDLITEMKERIARTDWAAKKAAAIKRFWQNQRLTLLPETKEPRRFEINPTIEVLADITALDGRVIVPAGTRVNLLEQVPFTGSLIVFDGAKKSHRATARRLSAEARAKGLRPILVTTRMAEGPGSWGAWEQLQQSFEYPVFLLQQDLRMRFRLEHVPAEVHAEGNRFVVTEIVPDDLEAQESLE